MSKPPSTNPGIMERTRAAVAYVNTARSPEHAHALEVEAFMAIFHPDVPRETVIKLKARGE